MAVQQKEFNRRRQQLQREMGTNSIAVLAAAPEALRNRDVHYPFRQDSDFFYLSQFPEPEAVMVLIPGRAKGEYILFCREKDSEQETWHGRRAGQEGAIEQYAADDSFPITDLDDILPGLLENKDKVFYNMGRYPAFDQRMMTWVQQIKDNSRSGVKAPVEFVSLEYLLNEMRLHKTQVEQRLMRKAAKIAATAHKRAMRACAPGKTEFAIEAELLYEFHRQGAVPAYPSIVAGGANGCILHYVDNTDTLQDGDLLLIDAGAEYQSYASDITRTFPVNGQFTELQAEVYSIVLAAQLAAIKQAIPGNHWNDPHQAAVKVITQGLIDLGVLKGTRSKLLKNQAYKPYYMHGTGHWLGMDVHDVGDYKIDGAWRLLEPGMALTVEPGLYFAANKKIPKALRNIGIRIEDDVLITRDGNQVLSSDVPKEISAIEALMAA